jgi:surface protein
MDETYDFNFELVFVIPASHEALIRLPIVTTSNKSETSSETKLESKSDDQVRKWDYQVTWGDGSVTYDVLEHRFSAKPELTEYNVKIHGYGITGFGYNANKRNISNYTDYLTKVLSFDKLGDKFTSLEGAFAGCRNLVSVPQSIPSTITTTSNMFHECYSFNQDISSWDMSNVTDLTCMFASCYSFNQCLDRWDVRNVKCMAGLFAGCHRFNQPLNTWNTSSVTEMSNLFISCENFNQPLDNWDVSNVTGMMNMFCDCDRFNQPLNSWKTNNVVDMSYMFKGCKQFNQRLDSWNVANVKNMDMMFAGCKLYSHDLSYWKIHDDCSMVDSFSSNTLDESKKPHKALKSRDVMAPDMKIRLYNILRDFRKYLLSLESPLESFVRQSIDSWPTVYKGTINDETDLQFVERLPKLYEKADDNNYYFGSLDKYITYLCDNVDTCNATVSYFYFLKNISRD